MKSPMIEKREWTMRRECTMKKRRRGSKTKSELKYPPRNSRNWKETGRKDQGSSAER